MILTEVGVDISDDPKRTSMQGRATEKVIQAIQISDLKMIEEHMEKAQNLSTFVETAASVHENQLGRSNPTFSLDAMVYVLMMSK